jgi:ubiquinol-cytochrome c reductase cytochrome c subunit
MTSRFSAFAVLCMTFAAGEAVAADATKGRETFMRVGCYTCHGTLGQGGAAGPKLAPNPMPLAAMRTYIRAPAQQMPPYREPSLPDADIADIHAYLTTIPPPPRLEDTILGAAANAPPGR